MDNNTNNSTRKWQLQLPYQIEQALKYCPTLPSLPGVALKILDLSRQPDVDINSVAPVLEKDPALAAKLLRVSRSPLYSSNCHNIRNVRDAIAILGLHTTIAISLGFNVSQTLKIRGDNIYGLQIWRRALLAGLSARCLGKRLHRVDNEELFLAGILQDLGVLAMASAIPEKYAKIWSRAQDHDMLVRLEHEELNCDHMQAGAWLMNCWRLPEYVINAVAGSNNPDDANPDVTDRQFISCVALSGKLADLYRPSTTFMDGDMTISTYMNQLACHAKLWCGLSSTDLEQILSDISSMIPEIEDLFEAQLTTHEQVQGVMDQAREISVIRNLQQIEKSNAI